MDSLDSVIGFLGWCSVINLGMLAVSSLAMVLMRGPISAIHGKMFQLSEADLSRAYFQFLAHYKIIIIVFNLVPYIALKIVA
jgi:hypothetical protein